MVFLDVGQLFINILFIILKILIIFFCLFIVL